MARLYGSRTAADALAALASPSTTSRALSQCFRDSLANLLVVNVQYYRVRPPGQ